ncbi:hypothetical protein ACT17_22705 [Mycolicibacterium conceptionense]|uniref:Methyltransferase n=1 Tax=Mycolicibacterium conceptionense TaxID=451644 RepID=A0A0J8U2Y0_9MYCO|nr:DNA methyltransferase [Mycolicibacterium conceptionense]KMV15913.1 hypothetical protein ACT17_22705 [Mycolicibacterium conceptionense]
MHPYPTDTGDPELTPVIFTGDALDVLRTLPDSSVDAVITDPPYGLTDIPPKRVVDAITRWAAGERDFVPDGKGFMSARWDRFVPPPAIWDECLRVLRPGGHLAAFSGARTQDLMGMSIRLAGFELRDSLAWISASRFPKGAEPAREIAKQLGDGAPEAVQWQGWSTALKPAVEPIVLARKPLDGNVATNLLTHGVGALHTDAVRVPFASEADETESKTKNRHATFGSTQGGNNVYGDYSGVAHKDYDAEGRFPPNVLLDGVAAAALDEQSGRTRSRSAKPRQSKESGDGWRTRHTGAEYDDVGGASRFFPRIEVPFHYAGRAVPGERPVVAGADGRQIKHTTVKPVALMSWLVRLLCPAGGQVLDPFAGSGTTLEAARDAGMRSIGVELDPDHVRLIEKRLSTAPGPERSRIAS